MNAGIRRTVTAIVVTTGLAVTVFAQATPELRRDIERRFDVLPLRDGLALHPKDQAAGYRSVEVTDEAIAVDGRAVTGQELRARLGSDAEPVLRLSYLDRDARRRLFGLSGATGPVERSAQPELPSPPPLPEAVEPPRPPLPPRMPAPGDPRQRGDRVRFGGSLTVGRGERVIGDVVVIGGATQIDGEVDGDVVGIGGSVTLGPESVVRDDVTVVGGVLRRDRGARIGGSVNEVGAFGNEWFWPNNRFFSRFGSYPWFSPWGSIFALMSTLIRLCVLSLLVCVVLLLGRGYIERVGARAAAEPLKAGLIGFLAQLLFVPLLLVVIVVLVITIIGIPLLALIPFGLLGLALVLLLGFSAVAYHLGTVAAGRIGLSPHNPYAVAILGIVVVLAPVLVARLLGLASGLLFPLTAVLAALGFAFEYVVWTIGLGAVALMRFSGRAA